MGLEAVPLPLYLWRRRLVALQVQLCSHCVVVAVGLRGRAACFVKARRWARSGAWRARLMFRGVVCGMRLWAMCGVSVVRTGGTVIKRRFFKWNGALIELAERRVGVELI